MLAQKMLDVLREDKDASHNTTDLSASQAGFVYNVDPLNVELIHIKTEQPDEEEEEQGDSR